MGYKISKEMKWTFIFNVVLFGVGICFDEEMAIVASVVIFVILSTSIEILEAIHEAKE